MKAKSRWLIQGALILAGSAALGYWGLRALLGINPCGNANFYNLAWTTSRRIDTKSGPVDLPIKYYRDDSFMGLFSAAYEPVRALLPSNRLHPIRVPNGRVVVIIIAFHYWDTDLGPYGEVGIAIPCTNKERCVSLLPLLAEGRFSGWGGFVLHLPVTSRVARDVGRSLWGYPKFVADMDFVKDPAYQSVELWEEEKHILTLKVEQQGIILKDNRPLISYSVLNDKLIKTIVPVRSIYQLQLCPKFDALELGDHPVAQELKSLDLSTTAIATRCYLTRSAILPAGHCVGPAQQSYRGHPGEEREYGRLTIRYGECGNIIDQYDRFRA